MKKFGFILFFLLFLYGGLLALVHLRLVGSSSFSMGVQMNLRQAPPPEAISGEPGFDLAETGWAIQGESLASGDATHPELVRLIRTHSRLYTSSFGRVGQQPGHQVKVNLGPVQGTESYSGLWPFSFQGEYRLEVEVVSSRGSETLSLSLEVGGKGLISLASARESVASRLATSIADHLAEL